MNDYFIRLWTIFIDFKLILNSCLFCLAVSVVDALFFRRYANKRLTPVTSTTMTSSKMECALLCMMTNTCSVASVTGDDDVIVCSLATSSNHVNNAQDDTGSDVLVLGEHLSTCSDRSLCFALSFIWKTWHYCWLVNEFSLNETELAAKLANSKNLINYQIINWGQFKDHICYVCLRRYVVTSWSLTQKSCRFE